MSRPEVLMSDWLVIQKALGKIRDFGFESENLRLADRCFYRPDFLIKMLDDSRAFVEVKGEKQWDDAVVKYKCAAEMYDDPFFLAVYKKKRWKIRQLPGPGFRNDLQDFFLGI
jgi:hypothetical protein